MNDSTSLVVLRLYAVEARARADGADLDELPRRRQHDSRPFVDRLHRIIGDLAGRATPWPGDVLASPSPDSTVEVRFAPGEGLDGERDAGCERTDPWSGHRFVVFDMIPSTVA